MLKLDRLKINAEIGSISVPPYFSKQSEVIVKYQKEWLGNVISATDAVI